MSRQLVGLACAAILLARSATAHMIMASPVPYSKDKLDNAPLAAGDYPCKQKIGYSISQMNNMAVGQQQTISFTGTAVHGGGSCQLSVTLDKEPTANSKFKVIKSIEGACPGLSGSASTFNFELPKEIPNGQATFAWTWFSKLSGAPEMYMNCAPITVTGGASDTTGFDALPDMLIANIPEAQCTSPQNFDTEYPNPGAVLQVASTESLRTPTGASCGTATGSSPSGSSAPDGASTVSNAPVASAPASSTPIASPPGSTPAASTPAAASSSAGGVFAPGASSGAPSTLTLTTMLTVTATGDPPASTGSGSGSSSNGSSCSPDGAVVCNGPNQFGLCNFGQVVWQDVAAGTTCSNGVISKRSPPIRVMNQARNQPGTLF